MNGICLIGGVLTTIAWSPGEWSLTKQVLGGLFAGGGFGFTVTATCFFGIVVADDPMTEETSEEVLEDHKHEIRSL